MDSCYNHFSFTISSFQHQAYCLCNLHANSHHQTPEGRHASIIYCFADGAQPLAAQ